MRPGAVIVWIFSISFLAAPVRAADRQPLGLKEAARMALEKSPMTEGARAGERAARAGMSQARAPLFPWVNFRESFTRGNNPVYVFGTLLTQRRFTAANFALASLNAPTPLDNYQSRFEGFWNLFDSRRSWFEVARASAAHRASERRLKRAEQETLFRVLQAYFAVQLAEERKNVAEEAVRTAMANLERAQNLLAAGQVVESDVLSARVHRAEMEQERIQASNAVDISRAELNHEMGVPTGSVFELTDALRELPPLDGTLAALEAEAERLRPDLGEAHENELAQQRALQGAQAEFGPKFSVFANWEADKSSFAGTGGTNFVAGAQIEINLFRGGADRARLEEMRARRDQATAMARQSASQVRLDVRRAFYEHQAAHQRLLVAQEAANQAQESLRIIENRYQAGLANITELLRAETTTHRARLDHKRALFELRVSGAALELAVGRLNLDSSVLIP
jgi:outer membrane protein TolC